jgi:hypothetical protein
MTSSGITFKPGFVDIGQLVQKLVEISERTHRHGYTKLGSHKPTFLREEIREIQGYKFGPCLQQNTPDLSYKYQTFIDVYMILGVYSESEGKIDAWGKRRVREHQSRRPEQLQLPDKRSNRMS